MKIILLVSLLFVSVSLFAQDTQLFEPLHYQNALQNETRSRDGRPGPAYWQNHADYQLEIRLDTLSKSVTGTARIVYYNASPDSLETLVFRVYPDRDKIGSMRNYPLSPDRVHEGAHIDTLVINGMGYNVKEAMKNKFGTNLRIPLEKKIDPGETAEISCTWNYPIENPGGRSGYYGHDSYFIAYFYPQIAVYDDINGWDWQLSHQGLQEFYNDVNNFQVSIHVPKNFRVWATGTLENAKAVYPPEIIQRMEKAAASDEIVHILTQEDLADDRARDSVWKFRADGVRDFAFGTSPADVWDGSSILSGNRRIAIHAVYPPDSKYNRDAVLVARKTVEFTTDDFPGVPFPYLQTTTFVDGPGSRGMEFPMIANNGDEDEYLFFVIVTFHEIFHNYTPFMLGTNEKRYTWMDEGWAKYTTDRFLEMYQELDDYPDSIPVEDLQKKLIDSYRNLVMRVEDRPLYDAFLDVNIFNWRLLGYNKPAIAYGLFIDMVGKKRFRSAMIEFMNEWSGKHPVPHDFFYSINRSLGENYNWFWKAWFFDRGYADLALEYKEPAILIKRVGHLPVPVKLVIKKKDGSEQVIEKSLDVWKEGGTELVIPLDAPENIESAFLDVSYIPDLWENNNTVEINP